MQPRTTVVVLRSLSYTGTTWLNLVLGTAARAFALGPPERLFRLLEKGVGAEGPACRVCGDRCPLWNGVLDRIDSGANVYSQLASLVGATHIVTNNPGSGVAAEHLRDPSIDVRTVLMVRDGRGTIESYLKYYPQHDPIEAIRGWFLPAAESMRASSAGQLLVRFEDVAAEDPKVLTRIAEHVGLELPASATRYWEHELHPVAGNTGAIAMRRLHLGQTISNRHADAWADRYRRLTTGSGERVEETWRAALAPEIRAAFDLCAGALNEQFGYQRERFDEATLMAARARLGAAPAPGERSLLSRLAFWRRGAAVGASRPARGG